MFGRESAVRGPAGPSSGLWRALRCLGLGRRARLGGAGVRQGDDGALSLLRAASDVGVLWMKPMDEGYFVICRYYIIFAS